MDKAPEKKGFSDLMSNIQGDKVLWIIVIMLYIVSLLAIFSLRLPSRLTWSRGRRPAWTYSWSTS